MASSSVGLDLNFVSVGQKGKEKLVRGGHQYYFQSGNKNGTQIWRCSNKGVRCNASVTLNSAMNTIKGKAVIRVDQTFQKIKYLLLLRH